MWDSFRLSAVGKFFLNKIAGLLVAAIMSAFLVTVAINPTTYAADATWSGDTITYNGQSYTKKSLTLPGVTDPSAQTFVSDADNTKVIVVPGGIDASKDNNVQEVTYTVDTNGTYSNPTGQHTLSVGAQANGSPANPTGQSKTTCAVTGIGWIVCSMSRFLAGAMDKAYGWIAEFLTIKPLTTDTSSGLFQSWNITRGLANACFIVAFLIIIYSQITNYGISNYEIKKMIPKLIIAAILVNVSYYICTIGVDLSNILGDSVSQALLQIRSSLPGPESQLSWDGLTTTILSAGTILAIPYATSAAGGVLALVPLLVPMLIGGVLSILVALMVLAARQAVVIVLVVISPLAFVAYLLPNTEKQFKRWRELFMNMLIIFPLFSLLFGGAQLASSIIIQSTNQITVVLIALFVQVAPLMITPFLMKVSHSLLTQVGGFMNDRNKGIVDRSRNLANEISKEAREKHRAKGSAKPAWTPSGAAYRMHKGSHHRQSRIKQYQDEVAAAVASDRKAKEIYANTKAAALRKNAAEAEGELLFEERKATDKSLQHHSGTLRTAQAQTKTWQAIDDARWEEAVSGKPAPENRYAAFAPAAHTAHREHLIAENNTALAQALQKSDFAQELSTNVDLQLRAGGIGGEKGAIKVKAKAITAVVDAGLEDVKAIKTASDIKPGDIESMSIEFKKAIATGDIASLRAHTDMLGSSKDAGINKLRELIKTHENDIRSNEDMLEIYRHHVNSNADINQGAEDIGVWSRDAFADPEKGKAAWRTLSEIGGDFATWKNMTSSSFAGMKASSQKIALGVRNPETGRLAISEQIARDIMKSPVARANLKEDVKPYIRARALGLSITRDDGSLIDIDDIRWPIRDAAEEDYDV